MPGGRFQDVLHGKIVFTFNLFQARSSCLCSGFIIHQESLLLHDGMKALLYELVTSLGHSWPSWFEIEHVENETFHYTSTTRKFLADKW